MATGTLQKLTTKGIERLIMGELDTVPSIWKTHCQMVNATAKVMPYAWAGAVPQPREFIGARRLKEIRAFTYDITSKTYELSILIPREWWEDDQTDAIKGRLAEMAQVWELYKSYLFTQMLVNGATSGNNAYDGNTFFHDTRTEGSSGTIDNKLTSAATTGTIPTSAEFLTGLTTAKYSMLRFLDDEGHPANWAASTQIRVIIPPSYEKGAVEALNASFISQTDNVFKGMAQLDIDPFLTADTKMYIHMVGAQSKGIIHQQYLPLKVVSYMSPEWIDANDGIVVTMRERFVFAYGNFRRMVEYTYS